MSPADDRLTLLLRTLREQAASAEPAWTNTNDADPGVTLVSLLAYLSEQLESRSAELPAASRSEAARIGEQLARLDPDDAPIRVQIDREPWHPVSDLATAAPDAAVFALDAEDGTIRFGDGIHGRRPPEGASVSATYRSGSGASGGVTTTVTGRWPLDAAALRVGPLREPRPAPAEPAGQPQLERPNFFTGQLLTPADLRLEQDYVREKLRRVQLAAFDVGVVLGLHVSVEAGDGAPMIVVSPGAALDPQGELIVLDREVRCPLPPLTGAGLVLLRYVERVSAFAMAVGHGQEDSSSLSHASRIAEGAAISCAGTMDDGAVLLARLTQSDGVWSAVSPAATPE